MTAAYPKAEIVKVGTVDEYGGVSGWIFDGHGNPNTCWLRVFDGRAVLITDWAIYVFREDAALIGGYTLRELRAIAAGADSS